MSALAFLVTHKAKNRIKEIFHRPGELVLLLIGVGLVFFVIFGGNMDYDPLAVRPQAELHAILLALYAFVFVLTAKNGFVNGASMFSMADVNFLFTGPNRSKTLLIYGLFSQMGRSLMLGVFILYQYGWIHSTYGVTLPMLFAILLGYAVTVFLGQMLAMLLYSYTSGSDTKLRAAKGIFYGIVVLFVAYIAYYVFSNDGELLEKALAASGSPVLHFFPVAGFVRLGVAGLLTGQFWQMYVAIGCFAACLVLFYLLISVLNMDYYEDVLKATEVSFSAITARKEGKTQEAVPRNVKVGKTGLSSGFGASAIAEKHKIENRRAKVLLLDMVSIVTAVTTVAFAFFVKDMLVAFGMSAYLMMLTVGTGRWAKELLLPYVYLIPEPPFKKLMHMLREQVPTLLLQSLLMFVPFYFIFRCSVLMVVALTAARLAIAWMIIGVNLLLQRMFGAGGSRALTMLLYFFLCTLFAAPGIVTAVVLYMFTFLSLEWSMLSLAAVEAVCGMLLLFGARNVLSSSEYNNK